MLDIARHIASKAAISPLDIATPRSLRYHASESPGRQLHLAFERDRRLQQE